MLLISTPFWSLLVVSALLTSLVGIISLRSRERQGALPLAVVMAAITIWSAAYAVEITSHSLPFTMIAIKIEYIDIVAVAPSWLIFAFSLNQWKLFKTGKFILSLYIIPAIILGFVWTNELHHLFWTSYTINSVNGVMLFECVYGYVFWVHCVYSYFAILTGTFLIFYRFLTSNVIGRYRFVYLLIPIMPLVANIMKIANISPFDTLDLTPFAFTITGLMLLWGSTRSFKLEIIPVAREFVMDNIEDGFIITDNYGEVIDANAAALEITGFKTNEEIQNYLIDNLNEQLISKKNVILELDSTLNKQNILVKIRSFKGQKKLSGRLISLTDITAQRQAEKELQDAKERYEAIFTGMPDALLVENAQGRIIDVNRAACSMYGYGYMDLVDKATAELIADDAKRITLDNVDKTPSATTKIPERSLNKRDDGEVFPVEVSGSAISLAGELVLLVAVRDITEQVKSEKAVKLREQYLQQLNRITWDALADHSIQEMLQTLALRMGEMFEASSVYITLLDERKQNLQPGAAYGHMQDVYPRLDAHTAANSMTNAVLENKKPIVAEDIYESPYLSAEISLMFPARSIMALPLVAGDHKIGAVMVAFDDIHPFTDIDLSIGAQASDQIALSISRAHLMQRAEELLEKTRRMNETLEERIQERTFELATANSQLRIAYDETINGWARALELREKETSGHSKRTVDMSVRFAQKLKIGGEQLDHIRRGAMLHDIGKMVIPDNILQKPGKLAKEERKIIEEHPIYSRQILGHIDYLAPAVNIPYYHHEKWDGSGYPSGLKGEEIPIEARLFALVDVWDALISARVYRAPLPHSEAVSHIKQGSGSHFDPALATIFIAMVNEDEK